MPKQSTNPVDTRTWLERVREALAVVRAAQRPPTGRAARGTPRRAPDGPLPFWLALHALVHACASRPMPGKFADGRIDHGLNELGNRIREAFELVLEDGPRSLIRYGKDAAGSVVDVLEDRLNSIENPPAKRALREDPKSLLAMPGMSTTQLLKMCPWLSEEDVVAFQSDPSIPFPEQPPAAPAHELPPIGFVRGDLFEIVKAIDELKDKVVVEFEDAEDAYEQAGSLRDERFQDAMAGIMGGAG